MWNIFYTMLIKLKMCSRENWNYIYLIKQCKSVTSMSCNPQSCYISLSVMKEITNGFFMYNKEFLMKIKTLPTGVNILNSLIRLYQHSAT